MRLDLGPSIGTLLPVDVGPFGTACARNASEDKRPNTLFVDRAHGLVKATLGREFILRRYADYVSVSAVDSALTKETVFPAAYLHDA